MTTGSTAGTGGVSVSAGMFPAGTQLQISRIADLAGLAAVAPPSGTAALVPGYRVTALSPDGTELSSSFSPGAPLRLALAAGTLPAGVSLDDLALAYWDGTAWLPFCAAAAGRGWHARL